MPATLLQFAHASDRCASTPKKLQKQAILADYFHPLDDQDLRLAVRFSAGRAFASTDERVLGASGAIVSDVIFSLLQLDRDEFWRLVVSKGEIGEALSDVWDSRSPLAASRAAHAPSLAKPQATELTLHEISHAFDQVASTGNQQRKREMLRELFARCAHPREAAYLTKIIFSDLRTGVRDGILQAAVAQAFARDLSDVRHAQLLIGDLGKVAILARHDRLKEARFQLFHPIQFMLATPQEDANEAAQTMNGRIFFAEDKLDGIRAQVHKCGDRIAIYTRTMDRIDESFPDVVESLRKIPGEFLLDGEIVPWRDGVVLPFAHIQKRLGRKMLTAKIISDNPAVFIAFDILYKDGQLLMDHPHRVRRAALETLTPSPCTQEEGRAEASSPLLITRILEVQTADQISAAFCNARECRNEGLVLKDPDSIYSPGRRGQSWLKLKTHLPTIDCVVTAAEYGHGKRRGVLSDYTFAVWDRDPHESAAQLVNIGKAYSGVTDEEIAQLTKIFLELSIAQRGHVHLVEPKIVLEIACDQIQKSARHSSGYALRFPRIKRIRWDKSAIDADRLPRIIEVYDSPANTARGSATEAMEGSEPTLFDGL